MKKLTAIIACGIFVAAASASSPTDALGRHNSKVTKTPKYTKQVEATQAKAATPVALKKVDSRITPMTGRYENRKVDGQFVEKYWLNNTEMDSTKYVNSVKTKDEAFANQINFQGRNYNRLRYFSTNYTFSTSTNAYYGQEMSFADEIKNNKVVGIDTFFNINTIIKDNGLYYSGIAKKFYGQNIGVYFAESATPLSANHTFTLLNSCTAVTNDGVNSINHASMVTRTLNHLAKEATIYSVDNHCLTPHTSVYPTRPDLMKPTPIYIGSHSYGNSGSATYNSIAQEADNYIYNTRVIEFASAGNAGQSATINKNISETGEGLNVITVGAALKNKNGISLLNKTSIKNPRMPATKESNYDMFYDKPEIMNYSNLFFNKDPAYTFTANNKTKTFEPTFSKTSAATPFMAGMTAVFLSQKPFYKWHPEIMKALLLTSSIKSFTPNDHQKKDHEENHNPYVGSGVPEYGAMIKGNRSRYWLGNNDDFFTKQTFDYKDGKKTAETFTFTEEYITKGKTYRIAIAWLSDGDLVKQNSSIPQDIDLMIYQEGQKPQYSTTTSNPFEMIEYTAPSSKRITVRIIRHSNKGGRVMLGYNMYEM